MPIDTHSALLGLEDLGLGPTFMNYMFVWIMTSAHLRLGFF